MMKQTHIAHRIRYIKKYLKILHQLQPGEKYKSMERFVCLYLRHDGVFVLRLIAKNAGEVIISELVDNLWTSYNQKFNSHTTAEALRNQPLLMANSFSSSPKSPDGSKSPQPQKT